MEDPKQEKQSPELKEELTEAKLKGVDGGAPIGVNPLPFPPSIRNPEPTAPSGDLLASK